MREGRRNIRKLYAKFKRTRKFVKCAPCSKNAYIPSLLNSYNNTVHFVSEKADVRRGLVHGHIDRRQKNQNLNLDLSAIKNSTLCHYTTYLTTL